MTLHLKLLHNLHDDHDQIRCVVCLLRRRHCNYVGLEPVMSHMQAVPSHETAVSNFELP